MAQDRRDSDVHDQGPQPGTQAAVVNGRGLLRFRNRAFVPQYQALDVKTDYQPAPSASVDAGTRSRYAKLPKRGMEGQLSVRGHRTAGSSTSGGRSYVRTGNVPTDVPTPPVDTVTNVRDADRQTTAPILAPTQNLEIRTPLVAAEWEAALEMAHIAHRYPQIPQFITYGAEAGIGAIPTTFAPPNHPSIVVHQEAFDSIVNTEFQKGRYWGPFSRAELEDIKLLHFL